MRKLMVAVAATLALAAVTAQTASAQTVTKFSVLTARSHGHRITNGFAIRGALVVPGDRDDVLGSFKARFTGQRGRHVRAVFFFPDGKIKANGNQSNNKVPIVGGTRRWNGASGKVNIGNLPHTGNVILTFTVVTG
jgi:hypothetical protein